MSHEEREEILLEMSDENIVYSDIPPLDEGFFRNTKQADRHFTTETNSIRIDLDILEWLEN